uniref:Uncharacterized protein AlNc14C45G3663 n=1 Tax=Albugo laibachii Nc14 TaxID=890382 RepID=F0WAD3_9STRA|nr:conserved hypothetical protein [Albugo laibachii Nc14]|eukprot:CCA18104.1 conserved hypothetical protein [Albugo laibachii Nc14]
MRRKRISQGSQFLQDSRVTMMSTEREGDDEGLDSTGQSCNSEGLSQNRQAGRCSAQLLNEGNTQSQSSRPTSQSTQISQMSAKTRDDLTARLVRYLLYKASQKQIVRFDDITKDVYPQYRNISRYFFEKACIQLEDIFGYQIVQIKDASRQQFLIINAVTDQAHLSKINLARHCSSKGFLMMTLGLLCCADDNQLQEDELWVQLKSADPKVERNQDHPVLGDLSALLKCFENELYLRSKTQLDPDQKKIKVYMYGIRAELEIGKEAILNFVCKLITGQPLAED